MPRIELTAHEPYVPLRVTDASGALLLLPRYKFLCWVRLPGRAVTYDAIIDTGSPFTLVPEAIWTHFRPGSDFEELPYQAGYPVPQGQTAGWNFRFRMARLLQPLVLFDVNTQLSRDRVIVQLVEGNPPSTFRSNAPPRVVMGLWGGALEGTNVRVETDATTGRLAGAIEW